MNAPDRLVACFSFCYYRPLEFSNLLAFYWTACVSVMIVVDVWTLAVLSQIKVGKESYAVTKEVIFAGSEEHVLSIRRWWRCSMTGSPMPRHLLVLPLILLFQLFKLHLHHLPIQHQRCQLIPLNTFVGIPRQKPFSTEDQL